MVLVAGQCESHASRCPGTTDTDRACWKMAVVSILLKERNQLRNAVRAYEAAEERMEKYKNGPYVATSLRNSCMVE